MTLKLKVGARLRELRTSRGLTQEALAELIDRSVDSVSAMERGVMLPGFESLERLADALQVPVSRLFEDGEEAGGDERADLLGRLHILGDKLPDSDLRLAVELVEVLTRRAGRSA